MNSILQLKGQFDHHRGKSGGGKRNVPVGKFVESAHILDLINDLQSLQTYWNEHTLIKAFCVVGHLTLTIPFAVPNLLEKRLISSMFSHTMLDWISLQKASHDWL